MQRLSAELEKCPQVACDPYEATPTQRRRLVCNRYHQGGLQPITDRSPKLSLLKPMAAAELWDAAELTALLSGSGLDAACLSLMPLQLR